jgi:ABC-type uncharacterized transport system auxiliary subunit
MDTAKRRKTQKQWIFNAQQNYSLNWKFVHVLNKIPHLSFKNLIVNKNLHTFTSSSDLVIFTTNWQINYSAYRLWVHRQSLIVMENLIKLRSAFAYSSGLW